MPESLLLVPADLDFLAEKLADAVAERVIARLGNTRRGFVDRYQMAEIANVSVSMVDRLVASESIPSMKKGSRRLFDPDAVLAALAES